MAYTVGSGATTADFMDALRSFAAGIGWTVNRWDTTAKRLYMTKGACKICFSWKTYNVTQYVGTVSTVVPEGIIQASLVGTMGSADAYNTFAGATSKVALSASTSTMGGDYQSMMTYMQGPFTQWFLFSNATGDYIHAIVQVAADRYRWLTFGNVDKGSLSHSGAAYIATDGGDYYYRNVPQNATYPTNSSQVFYNDPRYAALRFSATGNRFTSSVFQMYSIDALPSGFDNGVGFGSYNYNTSLTNVATLQSIHPLNTNVMYLDSFPSSQSANGNNCLVDPINAMASAEWAQNIPMMGIPLIAQNAAQTLGCCIGAIPDFRMINLDKLSPQQEFNITSDVWKVFPVMRQAPWTDSKAVEDTTSGMYGWAIKKIV